jgi:hypothetical protein
LRFVNDGINNEAQGIRRSSRRLARVLVPLLLGSWLTAAAAPCAAMAATAAVPETAEHAAHAHGDCPHCPPAAQSGGQLASAHGACDETQRVDGRATVIVKGDLKYALPGSPQITSCALLRPSSLQDPVTRAGPPGTRVALHILNCVYLI